MVVTAPIPSASVRMAKEVKAFSRARTRTACFMVAYYASPASKVPCFRLADCHRPLAAFASSQGGRLTIGRRLPACPTFAHEDSPSVRGTHWCVRYVSHNDG